MSKRSGSYKKREKLENLPVELDKNIKQKQLNENLESNPVYVMTNSAKNLNQTTPTTRSDPNQVGIYYF
ncbi:hypothetical protein BpHYR1_043976 [Brachionus plicatilis]|uniref:Uncharacterized protein n=1 Tax=Brachionus plicatilis TaxID=10195 RepID=A0A3M7RQT8_BRAPC|nr:hypothetical protein BpHYR1_043976 [Brachionus plicatilis]